MNNRNLESGDNKVTSQSLSKKDQIKPVEIAFDKPDMRVLNEVIGEKKEVDNQDEITPKTIDEFEIQLKERIVQCKNIITSLKVELNEEKTKLEKETKEVKVQSNDPSNKFTLDNANTSDNFSDLLNNPNNFCASVDRKLNCDENLIEYEKQLQLYQNTLNMAQTEKKNAIRKQMLAKAVKLKLTEIENQCNIELLRIKQSLQCLEPLQMIAEKWKANSNENDYDLTKFELIPRYPELSANSGSDVTNISRTDDSENKTAITNFNIEKED